MNGADELSINAAEVIDDFTGEGSQKATDAGTPDQSGNGSENVGDAGILDLPAEADNEDDAK